jgi:hypothetical protein
MVPKMVPSDSENVNETPANVKGGGQAEGTATGLGDGLAGLAWAIANLSAGDQARLAALLGGRKT